MKKQMPSRERGTSWARPRACCQSFSAINACVRSLWTLQTPSRTFCASVAGDSLPREVTTANRAVRGRRQHTACPEVCQPRLSIYITRARSVNKRWQSLGRRRRRRRRATRHHPPALLRASSPRSVAQRCVPAAKRRSKPPLGGGLAAPSSPPVEVPSERPASTEIHCLPNLRTHVRRSDRRNAFVGGAA